MAGRPQTRQAVENMLDDLINLVPKPWRPLSWPDGVTDAVYEGVLVSRQTAEAALARYLGARLIGSWIAYQGEGLRSVTASIVSAYASAVEGLRRTAPRLVTVGHLTSAVRAADWLLLHLVDRADWARWCADTEADRDAGRLVALVHAANASVEDLPWAR